MVTGGKQAHERISIHAPARGATTVANPTPCPVQFQSTHPHGVRPRVASRDHRARDFNPRTRTGCDLSTPGTGILQIISIHAPARGATCLLLACSGIQTFQSTHPHGVRPGTSMRIWGDTYFNPRTRTGCDLKSRQYALWVTTDFNPRTRTGCDFALVFIFREQQDFNPRTRTGCDHTPGNIHQG